MTGLYGPQSRFGLVERVCLQHLGIELSGAQTQRVV